MSGRLFLLICGLCLLFALAYQPKPSINLDVAAPSNGKFLDHFYPAENGARWTEARSGVWLPGLGRQPCVAYRFGAERTESRKI